MNRLRTIAAGTVALVLAVALSLMVFAAPAFAETDNPAQGASGWFVWHWHFDSQLGPSVSGKATFKMPWPATLVDVKCSGRLFGGTDGPVYTWTLKEAGTAVATCSPSAAQTEAQGTITDASIADEAVMTLDYGGAGTNPTADDMDVTFIFKRR